MPIKRLNIFLIIVVFTSITFLLFSCSSKQSAMFESLPASKTGISFTNKLKDGKLFNIMYYLYYYNGAGVATGDINNDGLPDIYFTANNTAGNRLYLNKGEFQFEDITEKSGVAGHSDWCTGVTMADINGDGWLDIYTSAISSKYNLGGHNELFINNGNNTFTESADQYGLAFSGLTTQTAFFDYDRDGDLDCYILNQSHHPHANIVDTSNRRRYDSLSGDVLLRNDIATTGKFTDVSAVAGIYRSSLGYGLGLAIADINNDGWDDIYVGNDFHENDYYYVNNGNGTFSESGAQHFKHYSRFSMGNDVADYNNDGQLDVVTADMLPYDEKTLKTYGSDENLDIYRLKLDMHGYQKQYSKNCLQRNNGDGSSFSETSLISGMSATDWSWAPLFADFDNDGNKDLFISSGIVKRPVDLDYIRFVSDLDMRKGRQQTDKYDEMTINSMPGGSSHPFFFKGDGVLRFEDMSKTWGTADMKGYYNGAAYADLDNDGNLDMVINCIDAPAVILKNNAPPRTMINVSLQGEGMNKFGIGTKIWVFTGNKMQYQQMMPTRGFQSSVEMRLHFGLDSTRYIDSVLVVWPDQKYQLLTNVPAKGDIQFSQREAGGVFDYHTWFPPAKELFKNVTDQFKLKWKHTENDFLDFDRQYLISHEESTRGPKIAVADVNKDGLDDFYVCGASGQPGQLMIQTTGGQFLAVDTAIFSQAKQCEEVDAVFFDANNDGYPDLYVVSGGNQYYDGAPFLADHLYLNNGKGHFTLSENHIPGLLKNKSCVSVADIDHDGDMDVFVGGLADAKQYGIPQPSWLLLNDGKGVFNQAPASIIGLDSLGIVTTSAFTDVNKDGWEDLVVTGEWMSVKIFINHNGVFTPSDINQSTGLWQTVLPADVNGDGYTDLLVGNWGCNNKFYSGKNGPLKLYVKDFDNNGSVEQIMCYTIDGNEYTFLAKDELERSLPVLKKSYLNYSDVAGKTVQYMFYNLFKDFRELKAETLSTCCFINDGKGNFTRIIMPDEVQLAPVFSFTSVKKGDNTSFVAAGNFYGVIPYEGQYDALYPTMVSYNPQTKTFNTGGRIWFADDEIRDMRWLNMKGNNPTLVIARNNNSLLFARQNE